MKVYTYPPTWALAACAVYFMTRIFETRRQKYYIMMAVFTGLATLTRFEYVVMFPIMVLWIWMETKTDIRTMIANIIPAMIIVTLSYAAMVVWANLESDTRRFVPFVRKYYPITSAFKRIPEKMAQDHFADKLTKYYPKKASKSPYRLDIESEGFYKATKTLALFCFNAFYFIGMKLIFVLCGFILLIHRKLTRNYIFLIICLLAMIGPHIVSMLFIGADYNTFRMLGSFPFMIIVTAGFIHDAGILIVSKYERFLPEKLQQRALIIVLVLMTFVAEPFNIIRVQFRNNEDASKILIKKYNTIIKKVLGNRTDEVFYMAAPSSTIPFMVNQGYIPYPKDIEQFEVSEVVELFRKYEAQYVILYHAYTEQSSADYIEKMAKYLSSTEKVVYNDKSLGIFELN
ncbi:hypothetical protein ACFLQV_01585 [Calditrichota bacterium]